MGRQYATSVNRAAHMDTLLPTQDYPSYLALYRSSELAAALLPCQWGYCEIGEHLVHRGLPTDAPLYAEWIRTYSSPEFVAIGRHLRGLVDRVAQSAGEADRAHMEAANRTSLRYELAFWEAAYRQEGWPG